MRRLLSSLLLVLFGLAIGIGAGWYLRGKSAPPQVVSPVAAPPRLPGLDLLVSEGRYSEVARRVHGNWTAFAQALASASDSVKQAAVDAYVSSWGESFDTLMYKAAIQARTGSCTREVDLLLSAAVAVKTSLQQQSLDDTLSRDTDECAKRLVAEKRFDAVDHMYEQVTLALPELASYYLRLGRFRIQTGNFDGALAVLAQIENHGELGAEARQLMRQVEASEAVTAPTGESLPLTAHGSQFVVNASIDDGPPVPLLIDTGAAMTVINADLLRRLGYSLQGKHAWFATAGGVVSAPVVSLHRFALGGAVIDELAVGALSVHLPGKVEGLLGMNFLRHFDFRIEQQTRILHLRSLDKRG